MNNLIKQIVESKFNFNIDVEGNDNNSLSKSKYNFKSLKELIELMEEVVDLGLPSGTLWCKYNLDVNPNLLSKAEDWYGKYYAWGELEGNKTKKEEIYFKWDNYKFGDGYKKELTKYCNDPKYGLNGFTDNLTKLLPEDDAAYLNIHIGNFKFHIPTKELCEELINYTSNYWVKNYDPNKTIHNLADDRGIQGLNGRVFEGKNENQLFIPATGFRGGDGIRHGGGSECNLWSSSLYLDFPYRAYYLLFKLNYIDSMHDCHRATGFNIRPVVNL